MSRGGSSRNLASPREFCARYPGRNERTGCPPYARREYEAVPLETIAGEVGDERKVRKEGRRRSLVQTEEPVFAPHAARRVCTSPRSITFAYLLLLHLSCPLLPPPAFLLLPPPFPSVTLLSHLSRHSTADNEPLLAGDYSSPSRDSERRVLLHEGLRHCERVLEEPCTRLRGRTRHDRSSGVCGLPKLRCRATSYR